MRVRIGALNGEAGVMLVWRVGKPCCVIRPPLSQPTSAVPTRFSCPLLLLAQVLNKTFYVDRGNFEDADLLARLVPGSSADMDGSSGSSGDGGVSAAHQEHKHSTPP